MKTEKRISDIKERLQATTPGIWKVFEPDDDYLGNDDPSVVTEDGQYISQTSYDGLSFSIRETAANDAKFIAHAKQDIEWLVQQLEILLGK